MFTGQSFRLKYGNNMQELQLLNDKLNLLLERYTMLQAENKRLKQIVEEQTKSIAGLNVKRFELEQNIVTVTTDKNDLSDNNKTNMRKQLDTVIGEIDKILATLND